MADKRCFVQFPHPGDEHKPDGNGKIGWNKRKNPHKRKFMQFQGEWTDENNNRHPGELRAWGEWEPESEVICDFSLKDGESHHPNYLWNPYWSPKDNYRCFHNTDPFIFGDCFIYSNCRQLPRSKSKHGLKQLDQGSVIAFGSKVKGEEKWALDTVLVVRDSLPYDPLNPREALEGEVPNEFLEVTGGPLTEDLKLKELADNQEAPEFRLYRGATPNDPVCGMYSFFPALPAGSDSGFQRPFIAGIEQINSRNWRTPKGHRRNLTLNELRCLWDALVAQIRNKGLVLGTYAEMPPACRARSTAQSSV